MTEAHQGDTVREGGCLCGAVRYRTHGEPLLVEYCHCGMCRRAGGAPVVVWADFPTERFAWTRGAPSEYRSSAEALRGFCARCGSPLTFRWTSGTSRITVTVGSLDDPGALAPQHHIFTAYALPWLHIEDDLPRYPEALPPRH